MPRGRASAWPLDRCPPPELAPARDLPVAARSFVHSAVLIRHQPSKAIRPKSLKNVHPLGLKIAAQSIANVERMQCNGLFRGSRQQVAEDLLATFSRQEVEIVKDSVVLCIRGRISGIERNQDRIVLRGHSNCQILVDFVCREISERFHWCFSY